MKLAKTSKPVEAERVETDDRPEIGSWWWVHSSGNFDDDDFDRPGKLWLGCVVEVGSNYANVRGVRLFNRIALDDFHEQCTAEPDPDSFIQQKLAEHKSNVRELMGEIQRVCHKLGVPFRQALAEAETTANALEIAHGVDDVKRHQNALVKARDKTLPELFNKVKKQHEAMATWMKADLIPAEAELTATKEVTQVINQKIHTIELYAGLQEDLEQVREGDPASVDERVRLMQRRHYMDEECLARYEAGGMHFKHLSEFDRWISRDENFTRIFPHKRCIVAFRVRRHDQRYDGDSLSTWISINANNKDSKQTFLYIRNGRQLWRMMTSIQFEKQLFPDRESHDLLGEDELWVRPGRNIDFSDIITGRRRAELIQTYHENRRDLARILWIWHRAGKPKGHWIYELDGRKRSELGCPSRWSYNTSSSMWTVYERLTPENIYYDDAMKLIAQAAFEHNRIAVIIQGLLDRSTCLHPHPPWRIWTPEGFAAGIELVYDDSRALTPGKAPDFGEYRKQLNKSLKVGSHTIGQSRVWRDEMVSRYGELKYWPNAYGNPGPSKIAVVKRVKRNGSLEYEWQRDRITPKWVPHPERPGYLKATYPKIAVRWVCPTEAVQEKIFCVDAYTPGDFHLFYDDPRTRAGYLKWAPYLLNAEDWYHARRNKNEDEDDNGNE